MLIVIDKAPRYEITRATRADRDRSIILFSRAGPLTFARLSLRLGARPQLRPRCYQEIARWFHRRLRLLLLQTDNCSFIASPIQADKKIDRKYIVILHLHLT